MITLAASLLVYVAFVAFAARRLLTYMHAFQQEEYDNRRFLGWVIQNRAVDRRLSLGALLIGVAWFFVPPIVCTFLMFCAIVLATYIEKDPRFESKKKLVVTFRVQRIYFPALGLAAVSGLWCFALNMPWLWLLSIHLIPLWPVLVNRVLQPYEERVQKTFWNEAQEKLESLTPKVIAITGSFGKTSVKHILGHVLKTHAPTLMTPGSVNTPMGIARIIREELDETHRFFIVEMGAYGPGSIERLCRLTPPHMGIITALGHAHYERFKSLEAVAKTKFELAESVLRRAGHMIVHERTLRFPVGLDMKTANPQRFTVCGEPPPVDPKKQHDKSHLLPEDLQINRVRQLPTGLEIHISWQGKDYVLDVPLYGIHHGHNVALAFAAAVKLGLEPESVIAALRTTPQIPHRLEVKRFPDGSRLIDDAYNSNPIGFRCALELLTIVSHEGRKILVTPGMVELGHAHDEAHEQIGALAGQICDVLVLINGKRIPTFLKGFRATGPAKTLVEVDSFQQASDWLAANRQPQDIVLIENDLPDIYERVPKF